MEVENEADLEQELPLEDGDELEEESQEMAPASDDGDEAADTHQDEPPRNGVQKRIDALTAEKYQLKGALDQTQRELAELRAEREARQKAPEPERKPPQAPLLEDFDGDISQWQTAHAKYVEDMIDYKSDMKLKRLEEQQRTQQQELQKRQSEGERRARFEQAVAEAASRYPDFQVVAFNPNLPITPEMGEAIQELENGADVAYYLGKNPERALRIAQMDAAVANRELGRISALVESQSVTTTQSNGTGQGNRNVSRAPKPPSPTRSGGGSPTKDPNKMTQAEYNEWRRSGGGK